MWFSITLDEETLVQAAGSPLAAASAAAAGNNSKTSIETKGSLFGVIQGEKAEVIGLYTDGDQQTGTA